MPIISGAEIKRGSSLWERLNHSIFETGAPHSLAALRILLGAQAAWQIGCLMGRFDLWFTPLGWLNSSCLNLTRTDSFSLLDGLRDSEVTRWFLIVCILCALSMAFGLFSRLSTLLTWVGVTSVQARVNPILCGGDNVLQFVLFYLIFADSGAAWSVDCLLGGARSGSSNRVSLWPQKLIAIQVCAIYLSAFFHKLMDRCWLDGTAVYYSLHYREFLNFPLPGFLREPPFTTLMTYGTVAVEGAMGLIFFFPKKKSAILLSGVALHIGIAYMMFIPTFGPVMCITYFAFLPGEQLKEFLSRYFKTRLSYPAQVTHG